MLYWAVAVAMAATFAAAMLLPSRVRAQEGTTAVAEVASIAAPQRIEMTVLGLSCPFCAYGLEKKLRKIEGLSDLEIELQTGRVVMAVADGSGLSDERIRQLVKEAGFAVEGEIERSSLSG